MKLDVFCVVESRKNSQDPSLWEVGIHLFKWRMTKEEFEEFQTFIPKIDDKGVTLNLISIKEAIEIILHGKPFEIK